MRMCDGCILNHLSTVQFDKLMEVHGEGMVNEDGNIAYEVVPLCYLCCVHGISATELLVRHFQSGGGLAGIREGIRI